MPATILLKQTTAQRNTDLVRSVPHYLTIVGIVLMLGIAWLLAGNTVSSEADSSAMVPIVRPVSETGGQKAESTENSLSPVMKKALAYVAQRYRVSADALRPVFEAAQVVGQERRIDPLLIVAIIAIESRFNPFAESPMGAQGLMQVIPASIWTRFRMTPVSAPSSTRQPISVSAPRCWPKPSGCAAV